MMPFFFGSITASRKAKHERVKRGFCSSMGRGTSAFACCTSTVFLAIILSKIVIVQCSELGDRRPLTHVRSEVSANLQSLIFRVGSEEHKSELQSLMRTS